MTHVGKKVAEKERAVRNATDTLFKYIFSEPKALAELYNVLSGNVISPEDIYHVNLDDKLMRFNRHNDTAFITKDNRLMVFVEHQSKHNENMPHRMLEYYVGISKILNVPDSKLLHRRKKVNYAAVEFYVAYNGTDELSEADKELFADLGAIKIHARVIDIRYEALPPQAVESSGKRVSGYAYLIEQLKESRERFPTKFEAFLDAVEKCKSKGYLLDILNQKELVDVFAEHYNYDEQLKADAFEDGLEEGREEGREQGREQALKETALEMLKKGMTADIISELVKMPASWVEALK